MFNVRLAGGHLYGKQLFTWLSLVVSLMASSVLSFFPLDVLDEIWDLIESVSEGFLTYSSISIFLLWGGGAVVAEGGVNIMYKCFKWHFYSSRNTNVPNYSKIHA